MWSRTDTILKDGTVQIEFYNQTITSNPGRISFFIQNLILKKLEIDNKKRAFVRGNDDDLGVTIKTYLNNPLHVEWIGDAASCLYTIDFSNQDPSCYFDKKDDGVLIIEAMSKEDATSFVENCLTRIFYLDNDAKKNIASCFVSSLSFDSQLQEVLEFLVSKKHYEQITDLANYFVSQKDAAKVNKCYSVLFVAKTAEIMLELNQIKQLKDQIAILQTKLYTAALQQEDTNLKLAAAEKNSESARKENAELKRQLLAKENQVAKLTKDLNQLEEKPATVPAALFGRRF